MKKILERLVDIWKLDFLAKFFAAGKNDNKTTVLFWILSNVFLGLVIAAVSCISICGVADDFVDWIDKHVPEGARITFTDGQLTTENIDKPFFREINAHNGSSDFDGNFVLVIDTSTDTYDITSLDEYDTGIIVLGDRAYIKGESDFEQLLFSEVPNFSLSKDELISFVDRYFVFPFAAAIVALITVVMLIWLLILRLIAAFWWALMLFILIKIFDIRETYMTAYKAVLNLYFIPTLVVLVLAQMHINVPLLTTMIFIAIFIANLIWLKRQPEPRETEVVKSGVREESTDSAVITNPTKNSDR